MPAAAPRHGPTPIPALLALLALSAGLCACGSTGPETVHTEGEVVRRAVGSEAERGSDKAPEQAATGPVTHLGRTVLDDCDLVLRGRVIRLDVPVAGAELAEIEPLETFRSGNPDGEGVTGSLHVLCGAEGKLPRAGQQGIFFLRTRRGSSSHVLVEVSPLEDKDGAARLEALRHYVRIEDIADRGERVTALLTYLRSALGSGSRWTRDNAVREYAAFAQREAHSLSAEDARALMSARSRVRDPDISSLLDRALSAVPATPRAPVRRDDSATRAAAGAPVAVYVRRYREAQDDPDARRAAVADASALGANARPLFEIALADAHPAVRAEATVAVMAAMGLGTEARAEGAGEASADRKAIALLLQERLTEEPETRVRAYVIRALGRLHVDDAVASLTALAGQDGELGREACFALARIRTPRALEALAAVLNGATDAERRDVIQFLRSDAFLEQERLLDARR